MNTLYFTNMFASNQLFIYICAVLLLHVTVISTLSEGGWYQNHQVRTREWNTIPMSLNIAQVYYRSSETRFRHLCYPKTAIPKFKSCTEKGNFRLKGLTIASKRIPLKKQKMFIRQLSGKNHLIINT